jgi:hypothetical protein
MLRPSPDLNYNFIAKQRCTIAAALDIALSDDTLLEVCLFVGSFRDLVRLAAASRTLWRVATSDIVWRARWRRERGTTSLADMTQLQQLHPTSVALGAPSLDAPKTLAYSGRWMQSFLATGTPILHRFLINITTFHSSTC